MSIGAIGHVVDRAAAEELPFTAQLDGNAHLSPTDVPWIIRNDETGDGEATHLGQFTFESVEFVDFSRFPAFVSVNGAFRMTAANGDRLDGTYTTVGILDFATDNLMVQGQFRITGGTGRYANASGGGDLSAIASLGPGLPFTGRYNGNIKY
jgi:hypothetical protein